jgi:hypothetical protein
VWSKVPELPDKSKSSSRRLAANKAENYWPQQSA